MDLPSLLRARITNLPSLLARKNHLQPWVCHYKQHLGGAPKSTTFADRSLLLPANGVATVANGSHGAAVATVANGSAVVATVANDSCGAAVTPAPPYLPFQTCQLRILLKAFNAEFCPRRSGSVSATRHATCANNFGFHVGTFHHERP